MQHVYNLYNLTMQNSKSHKILGTAFQRARFENAIKIVSDSRKKGQKSLYGARGAPWTMKWFQFRCELFDGWRKHRTELWERRHAEWVVCVEYSDR